MRNLSRCLGSLLAALLLAITFAGAACGASKPPLHRHVSVATPAQMQAGLAAAIHADVAASVYDPARSENVFVMGDATVIDGVSQTTSGYFPRNELVVQAPGSATFTVLPGPYGPKDANGHTWEQVPGQANGNFWPAGILFDGSSIWLFGNAVTGLQTVGDAEVAQFSASTLVYEGVTDLGIGTETWGSSVPDPLGGFWLTGTQQVCSGATDCKQGDVAWVPAGGESYPASWDVTDDVFPPGLNAGTIISPATSGSGEIAVTKQGDEFGGNVIEELAAPSMTGPWTLTGKTWPAEPTPPDLSYDVQVHLNEGASAGELVLSYAVNCSGQPAGSCPQYWPDFLEVTP